MVSDIHAEGLSPDDFKAFIESLDPDDSAELHALGVDPAQAVIESIGASERAWALQLDGDVACIWGVVRRPWGGQLWFLTSTALQRKPMAFYRVARDLVPKLVAQYGMLQNIIDARHERAIRLAKHLGAQLGDPITLGPFGEQFVPFRMEAQHVYRS